MAGRTYITNALSFDLEEWFQAEVFHPVFPESGWDDMESRVGRQTDAVLELLDAHGVRATFFVLGWVAERHAGMVDKIAARGHEVACHGYAHTMITEQGRDEFREDLVKAKKILEEAGVKKVTGYRAPTFSVVEDTRWALDVLLDEGFVYDSSIYPIRHDRYGIPGSPRAPYVALVRGGRELWEFPGPTIRLAGMNLPAAGGGYLRMFPLWWSRAAIRRMNRDGHPINVFAHPWEFDGDIPRVGLSPVSRLRHYGGIGKNLRKLKRLLSEFRFAPVGEVISGMKTG